MKTKTNLTVKDTRRIWVEYKLTTEMVFDENGKMISEKILKIQNKKGVDITDQFKYLPLIDKIIIPG